MKRALLAVLAVCLLSGAALAGGAPEWRSKGARAPPGPTVTASNPPPARALNVVVPGPCVTVSSASTEGGRLSLDTGSNVWAWLDVSQCAWACWWQEAHAAAPMIPLPEATSGTGSSACARQAPQAPAPACRRSRRR